jgi:hypothetical protein
VAESEPAIKETEVTKDTPDDTVVPTNSDQVIAAEQPEQII